MPEMVVGPGYGLSFCSKRIITFFVIQIIQPTWDLLGKLVQSCQQELLICSPWLPASGLQQLRDALRKSLRAKSVQSIQFWSRLADPNTDSGLILEIVDELKRAKVQVQLKDSPILHAKIYLADRSSAIIGSCNLSDSGFVQNLEIAALISEPEVHQVCTLVANIEKEMKLVALEDLAYFVEHQRPMILQQQTISPSVTVVPIWREEKSPTSWEREKVEAIQRVPRIARPSNIINPMEVFGRGLNLLNEHHEHIALIDIGSFIGQKIKVIIYPADFTRSMIDGRWAKGQPPFEELEGKIIGEYKPMNATKSYTDSTLTGEAKMTWRFLPKHARTKDSILANFPVKNNPLDGREVHYVSSIKRM